MCILCPGVCCASRRTTVADRCCFQSFIKDGNGKLTVKRSVLLFLLTTCASLFSANPASSSSSSSSSSSFCLSTSAGESSHELGPPPSVDEAANTLMTRLGFLLGDKVSEGPAGTQYSMEEPEARQVGSSSSASNLCDLFPFLV